MYTNAQHMEELHMNYAHLLCPVEFYVYDVSMMKNCFDMYHTTGKC